MQTNQIKEKEVKKLNGYFTRRYRNGSYKARKLGIGTPILLMAKRGGDRLRLYGTTASETQLRISKTIFAGWKQKTRELRRIERQRNKAAKASLAVKSTSLHVATAG